MRRSTCLLRISAGQVHGVWHGPSWGGGQRTEAVAAFTASGSAPTLGEAIDGVLAAIHPARRLTSPFVCVTLEGALIMAAILPFTKLPKAQGDRRLIISQRFCREHRLEAGKVEIIAGPLTRTMSEKGRILCLAMERDTVLQIRNALEKRGLHADVIRPEYLQKFEQVSTHPLEKPAIALFEEHGFRTVLVWDGEGTIAHIANLRRPSRQDLEGQRRMATRIRRYALIVARQGVPVPVYVDASAAGVGAPDLAHSKTLKLLNWPGQCSDFRRAAE